MARVAPKRLVSLGSLGLDRGRAETRPSEAHEVARLSGLDPKTVRRRYLLRISASPNTKTIQVAR